MVEARKYNAVKRLGVRYGRKTRARVGIIESESLKKHLCPSCRTINVRRVSAGIWQCRKCSHKFTSRAYTVEKTPSVRDSQSVQNEPQAAEMQPISSEAETQAQMQADTPAETN